MRIPDMKKVRLGVAVLAALLLGVAVPEVASAGASDGATQASQRDSAQVTTLTF